MEVYDADSSKLQEALIEEAEDRIRKATALHFLTQTEGYDILLNTFENMKQDQLDELSKQPVGNDKAVLAAHAVWSATVHALDQIVDGISFVINDGEAAKQELNALRNIPENEN